MLRYSLATSVAVLITIFAACNKNEVQITADDQKFQEELRLKLANAKSGTTIALPAGTFHLEGSLSLSAEKVTLRGAGMDKTILSFKGQKSGAEGLTVSGNDFIIEDMSIQDTKGDALKITKVRGVTIRRFKAEWTGGPNEKNGAYGLYPVQCENVLIEDSVAIGASDAGIYVGQSKNIVVRRNRAEYNVAGIEIENSTFADVYDNVATNNTGGILVFDLPDLPVQGGKNTRVFNNRVHDNNTDNFAPAGNIVALVPTGTGVMVMANDNIEIFKNEIRGHATANMTIVSYLVTEKPIKDKNYDPYPEGIYVHDNTFADGGKDPQGLLVKILSLKLGTPFPDILYDGIVDQKKTKDGQLTGDQRICIKDNGQATFANIDAGNTFKNIDRDITRHACAHLPVAAIRFPGVDA